MNAIEAVNLGKRYYRQGGGGAATLFGALTGRAGPKRAPGWKRIGRWFTSRLKRPGAAPSNPELDGTLDYLEDLMEVVNDTHPR